MGFHNSGQAHLLFFPLSRALWFIVYFGMILIDSTIKNFRTIIRVALGLLCLAVIGCATIPNGGHYGDISKLGTPGPVLGQVEISEGMLVDTIHLDDSTSVNIQINEDKPSYSKQPLYENVLTIGKFSKLIGSGFTKKENIYYRKRIYYNGQDVFELNGRHYLVSWNLNYRNPLTYVVADTYTFTIQELIKP